MMGMALSFGIGVGFGPGGVMQEPAQRSLDLSPRHVYIEPSAQDIEPNTVHEHQPAGQHLLVDLKGVDKEFLNAEERLAAAMVEVINEGGLTLLSYHCHALVPSGVSCVGVLLESHISLQSTYNMCDSVTANVHLPSCTGLMGLPLVPLTVTRVCVGLLLCPTSSIYTYTHTYILTVHLMYSLA
jgi:S-adenosylmethionine/arginine decarboxylase-like enzyme